MVANSVHSIIVFVELFSVTETTANFCGKVGAELPIRIGILCTAIALGSLCMAQISTIILCDRSQHSYVSVSS